MRIIDADVLSYALFQKHDAHPYCWPLLQNAVHGKTSVAIATANLLEVYHAIEIIARFGVMYLGT